MWRWRFDTWPSYRLVSLDRKLHSTSSPSTQLWKWIPCDGQASHRDVRKLVRLFPKLTNISSSSLWKLGEHEERGRTLGAWHSYPLKLKYETECSKPLLVLTYVTFCAINWFLLKAVPDHISHHQRLKKYQVQTTSRLQIPLRFLFSRFWLRCGNSGPYFSLSFRLDKTRQDKTKRPAPQSWSEESTIDEQRFFAHYKCGQIFWKTTAWLILSPLTFLPL